MFLTGKQILDLGMLVGLNVDKEMLDEDDYKAIGRYLITSPGSAAMNRYQYPRHSPAVSRTALHTLPATADH